MEMPGKTLNYEVTKCSTSIYITTVKILFYMYIYTEEMHYNTGGYAVENSNFFCCRHSLQLKHTFYFNNLGSNESHRQLHSNLRSLGAQSSKKLWTLSLSLLR